MSLPCEYWDSILEIGAKIGREYENLIGHDDKHGHRWFRKVSDTINDIRQVLKIISLGIDYKKYAFFKAICPDMGIVCKKDQLGWEPNFLDQKFYESSKRLTEENCNFAVNFVIDCAVKLQEFDFDRGRIFKTQDEIDEWEDLMKMKYQKK